MKNSRRPVFMIAAAIVTLSACSGIGGPVQGDRDTALAFDRDYMTVFNAVTDGMRKCRPEWNTTAHSFADLRAAYVTSTAAASAPGKVAVRVDIASAGAKRTNVTIYAGNARQAQSEASLIKAWVDGGSRSCKIAS